MKCEGSCESHDDDMQLVHVRDPGGYDWGLFWYCSNARAEDRRRGLIVVPSKLLEPSPKELEGK